MKLPRTRDYNNRISGTRQVEIRDDLQEHVVWSIIMLTVDGVRRERKINHVKRKSYAYKAEVPRAQIVAENSKKNIS